MFGGPRCPLAAVCQGELLCLLLSVIPCYILAVSSVKSEVSFSGCAILCGRAWVWLVSCSEWVRAKVKSWYFRISAPVVSEQLSVLLHVTGFLLTMIDLWISGKLHFYRTPFRNDSGSLFLLTDPFQFY